MSNDSTLVHDAAVFAIDRHYGQTRKGNELAVYATHPLRVGETLARYGFPAEVVAAGFCHDLTEDASTDITEIDVRFGSRVGELVRAASEPDKSLSWEERKRYTVEKIKTLDVDQTALVVADKLDWHESVLADIAAVGSQVWAQFKRGEAEQRRHFAELAVEFSANAQRSGDERLKRLVARYLERHQELFFPVALAENEIVLRHRDGGPEFKITVSGEGRSCWYGIDHAEPRKGRQTFSKIEFVQVG